MKKMFVWLVLAVVVVMAGCATAPAPAPTPAPTPAPVDTGAPVSAASVEFVSVPSEVEVGKSFSIAWKVSGADTTPHTALHYGFSSKADVTELTTQTYPSAAPKSYLSGDTSNGFETSLLFGDVVTVYVRVHALVDGENVWTEEKMVKIIVPSKSSMTTKTASDDAMSADTTSSGY